MLLANQPSAVKKTATFRKLNVAMPRVTRRPSLTQYWAVHAPRLISLRGWWSRTHCARLSFYFASGSCVPPSCHFWLRVRAVSCTAGWPTRPPSLSFNSPSKHNRECGDRILIAKNQDTPMILEVHSEMPESLNCRPPNSEFISHHVLLLLWSNNLVQVVTKIALKSPKWNNETMSLLYKKNQAVKKEAVFISHSEQILRKGRNILNNNCSLLANPTTKTRTFFNHVMKKKTSGPDVKLWTSSS